MNQVTSILARSFFQKDSLEDCAVEELRAAANEFPYCLPVQYLLAEKLRVEGDEAYPLQLKRLSLHFSNPLILDYLVNKHDEAGMGIGKIEYAEEKPAPAPAFNFNMDENAEGFKEFKPQAPGEISPNEETGQEEKAGLSNEENNPAELNSNPAEEITQEEMNAPGNANLQETVEEETPVPVQPAEQNEFHHEEEKKAESPAPSSISQTNTEDVPSNPEPISFEPFHTVDYFASQGIKFVQDEKPVDRFGKQLKSFTEWLKTMKRLPQTEMVRNVSENTDPAVEKLADHSVQAGEVITEAMAEVWSRQGNREKAIDVYTKLSLLNPSKSHYFASKIEQIKNS